MDSLKFFAQAILQGFYDSVKGIVLVFSIDSQIAKMHEQKMALNEASQKTSLDEKSRKKPESKVMKHFGKCCLLNGCFAWVIIIFFECIVLPFVKYILSLSMGHESDDLPIVWLYLSSVLQILFKILYVLPIYLLSRIVNSIWFQDIANAAYKLRKGRTQMIPSISRLLADLIINLLVQGLFLIQSLIVSILPIGYFSYILYLVHLAFLYALYSFEYKWINMGWELHKRLSFIEINWPYFIGFGMPLTILTNLSSSYVVSGCIFAILFPIFILSANEAVPVLGSCDFPLKLFSPVVAVSNLILTRAVTIPTKPNIPVNVQPLTTNAIRQHNQTQSQQYQNNIPPMDRRSSSNSNSLYYKRIR